MVRRTVDGGGTWKSKVILGDRGEQNNSAKVVVVGAKVFVVWSGGFDSDSTTGRDYSIMFRRSTDDGATWKVLKELSSARGGALGDIAA